MHNSYRKITQDSPEEAPCRSLFTGLLSYPGFNYVWGTTYMETRPHIHEETFQATPEQVFALLHTPSAIRAWWQASRVIVIAEEDGLWCATWGDSEDEPEYVSAATIEVFEPARRMVLGNYRYVTQTGGLPFEADFTVEFLITAHANGTSLRVTQDGFPVDSAADAYFEACQEGWTDTFAGIRRFLAAD